MRKGRFFRVRALRMSGWVMVSLASLGFGCSYRLQGSSSPWLEKEGIRRIYVSRPLNNTYKSGVENLIYNALLRTLAGNHIQLVEKKEEAEAVLTSTVTQADFNPSASATAQGLPPEGLASGFEDIPVATEYNANLHCLFSLNRRVIPPGKKEILWTGGFARSKPFPASNTLGGLGTTSALMNESEFDRVLAEMAHDMMINVRESMMDQF